jgi:hypothetical protein
VNHATGESTIPRTVIAKSIQAVGFCAKSPCIRFHNHVTIIDFFLIGAFMMNLPHHASHRPIRTATIPALAKSEVK